MISWLDQPWSICVEVPSILVRLAAPDTASEARARSSALRGAELGVRPGGTRTSRSADAASGPRSRTARNTRGGRRRKILRCCHTDDPRTGKEPSPKRPGQNSPAARAGAGSELGASACPSSRSGTGLWPSTPSRPARPSCSSRHSSGSGSAEAGTTPRTARAGRAAAFAFGPKVLDVECRQANVVLGPRERSLLLGQVLVGER